MTFETEREIQIHVANHMIGEWGTFLFPYVRVQDLVWTQWLWLSRLLVWWHFESTKTLCCFHRHKHALTWTRRCERGEMKTSFWLLGLCGPAVVQIYHLAAPWRVGKLGLGTVGITDKTLEVCTVKLRLSNHNIFKYSTVHWWGVLRFWWDGKNTHTLLLKWRHWTINTVLH